MEGPVVYQGGSVCNELMAYTETPRRALITPSLHQRPGHTSPIKKPLPTLTPDHSPQPHTPLKGEAGGPETWDSQWFLRNQPQSQPTHGPWLGIHILPRKPSPLPNTE